MAVHGLEGEAAAAGDQAGLRVGGKLIRQGHGEVIGIHHGVGIGDGGLRSVKIDGVGVQVKFGVGQRHGGAGSRLGGEIQGQGLAQGHSSAVAADAHRAVVVLHRQVGGVTGLGVQDQGCRVIGKGHVIGIEAGDALFPGGDGHRNTHLLIRRDLLVSTHGNSIAGFSFWNGDYTATLLSNDKCSFGIGIVDNGLCVCIVKCASNFIFDGLSNLT